MCNHAKLVKLSTLTDGELFRYSTPHGIYVKIPHLKGKGYVMAIRIYSYIAPLKDKFYNFTGNEMVEHIEIVNGEFWPVR